MRFTVAISTGQDGQRFKYNDKELDLMHGLNMYDYSARGIDMANPRFTTQDPLAEKYYSISPYAYCANNPVNYIDPDGMAVYIMFENGRIIQLLNGLYPDLPKVIKLNFI
jgi:RHS repeat-associated protein